VCQIIAVAIQVCHIPEDVLSFICQLVGDLHRELSLERALDGLS
jgi:hypothetical protein